MTKLVIIVALVVAVLWSLRWLWRRYTSVDQLPDEVREFVLRRARQYYAQYNEADLGHIAILHRHCRQRMVAVWVKENTSRDSTQDPQYKYATNQIRVCRNTRCGYTFAV